jgi:Tripartite tricarboxylate transporter TctB family
VSRTRFSGQHVMTLSFALISIGVIVQSLKWPFKTALFPVIIGGCALILSLAEFSMSLYETAGGTKKKKKQDAMDFKLSEGVDPAVARRRTWTAFGWIIGFFFLIVLFGFNIGIPLFVFLYVKCHGGEKWLISILMTVGSWIFFWGLFIWLLDTPMPEGWVFRWLYALGIGS